MDGSEALNRISYGFLSSISVNALLCRTLATTRQTGVRRVVTSLVPNAGHDRNVYLIV